MGKVSCKNSLFSCLATDCMREVFVASIFEMAIAFYILDCYDYVRIFGFCWDRTPDGVLNQLHQ